MSNIVTFDQAKKLKELGFDFPCWNYRRNIEHPIKGMEGCVNEFKNWNKKEESLTIGYNEGEIISAPSVSDALQWIRDNKRIVCAVTISSGIRNTYNYDWYDDSDDINAKSGFNRGTLSSFPETESALLDELLTYLENMKL